MPDALTWLPWLPPLCYLAGAFLTSVLGRHPWQRCAVATRGALLAAALACAGVLGAGHGGARAAAGLVELLVAFLGWIIGDFSQRHLRGESGQRRFVLAFLMTLAAVDAVVASENLALLIGAWAASSAGLHQLLTFYRDRPAAHIVAHKKFLVSRMAEACLLAAAVLLYREWGTLEIPRIAALAAASPALPLAASAAALLIALAVLLKCAQLPLHGWLIQVMEAPTPVSALLHAGVVNLGGFVLIRFAPLLAASPAARSLLVACGLASALLAGMVSLTRVSIKVRLAWSTVAQMGFMVLECGLGLYVLAALHLLGHSLYKAHAFLSASSAVREGKLRALRDAAHNSAASVLAAPFLAAGILVLLDHALGAAPWPWWWTGVLAAAWAPLLWWPAWSGARAGVAAWRVLAGVALVAALGLAALLAHRLELGTRDLPWAGAGPLALAGMACLYAALAALQLAPGRLETLRRWSYAGFYVDEIYTRAALRLWPARWGGPARTGAAARRRTQVHWSIS